MDTSITEAEFDFCMYKLGNSGSGMTKLIDAIFALDTPNRVRMAQGFPELVKVVNSYNFVSGYWEDLVRRWNFVYPHMKLVA